MSIGDPVPLIEDFRLDPPDDDETLSNFVKIVNPGGPGWKKYQNAAHSEVWQVPNGIIAMILGCITIYGVLIGVGQIIYGNHIEGLVLFVIVCLSGLFSTGSPTPNILLKKLPNNVEPAYDGLTINL